MKLKRLFLSLLVLCIAAKSSAATPWLHVEGNQLKDPTGNKVVLRGVSLEYLETQAQSSLSVNGLIDILTDESNNEAGSPGWYTRVVRLPVHPEAYLVNPTAYYDTHIKPAVDYCTQKGLYVIIDWHYVASTTNHVSETTDFWNFIAPKFKDYSNVIFELYNEPINQTDSWWTLRGQMQTWYNAVRTHAPDNIVLVGNREWDQHPDEAAADPVIGSNIMYVLHIYANHWNWISGRVQDAAASVPIFMTEWGFKQGLGWDTDEDIAQFGQPVLEMAENLGISWTAWAASDDFEPTMFHPNWTVRVGSGEMGGFVKDWLYDKRNSDQPVGDSGPYELTITVSGNGSYSVTPVKNEYDQGETVTLTASSIGNSIFQSWSGGHTSPDQTTQVIMTGDKEITLSFFDPVVVPGLIEAEDYFDMFGIQLEDCSEGGQNVGYIDVDDWLTYQIDVTNAGEFEIVLRLASEEGTGAFQILVDNQVVTTNGAPNTSGWQIWEPLTTAPFEMTSGVHELKLVATGSPFNVNWLDVKQRIVLGDDGVFSHSKVDFFPNPSSNYWESATSGLVTIRTLDGRIVFSDLVSRNQPFGRNLVAGSYLIDFEENGNHSQQLLVKH